MVVIARLGQITSLSRAYSFICRFSLNNAHENRLCVVLGWCQPKPPSSSSTATTTCHTHKCFTLQELSNCSSRINCCRLKRISFVCVCVCICVCESIVYTCVYCAHISKIYAKNERIWWTTTAWHGIPQLSLHKFSLEKRLGTTTNYRIL